jgi:hypothetical protein
MFNALFTQLERSILTLAPFMHVFLEISPWLAASSSQQVVLVRHDTSRPAFATLLHPRVFFIATSRTASKHRIQTKFKPNPKLIT